MSSKINFSLISIVVLTIFVKIVPAPILRKEPQAQVTWKILKTFEENYTNEINNYCEINNIKIDSDQNEKIPSLLYSDQNEKIPSLLYFKKLSDDFNRYNQGLRIASNHFIHFAILRKQPQAQDYTMKDIETYTKLQYTSMIEMYKIEVFRSLTPKLKDEYFLKQFLFYINYANSLKMVNNKPMSSAKMLIKELEEEEITYAENEGNDLLYIRGIDLRFKFGEDVEFIQLYREEINVYISDRFSSKKNSADKNNHSSMSDTDKATIYIVDHYVQFLNKWYFYKLEVWTFAHFLLFQKQAISVDIPSDKLQNFLTYFKESLDSYYTLVTALDISTLSDDPFYYKRMLTTMGNMYKAYLTEITIVQFVDMMISVAKTILEARKKKNILDLVKDDIYSNDKDGFRFNHSFYKCGEQKCELPKTVNFKDVLDYLIGNFVNNRPITIT